ncbi:hypothetical protein ARMSODRAFT_980428 [Armillaria solidipes]|uniref:Uncharacterized protein n=1 Tax=Armillaria solidipes TaxID=1076256 RepID=A0A2H3AVR2_9AGAR|nr:hypothetical protein ARMSODRAFT_980428 [Armillaria solidipes]
MTLGRSGLSVPEYGGSQYTAFLEIKEQIASTYRRWKRKEPVICTQSTKVPGTGENVTQGSYRITLLSAWRERRVFGSILQPSAVDTRAWHLNGEPRGMNINKTSRIDCMSETPTRTRNGSGLAAVHFLNLLGSLELIPGSGKTGYHRPGVRKNLNLLQLVWSSSSVKGLDWRIERYEKDQYGPAGSLHEQRFILPRVGTILEATAGVCERAVMEAGDASVAWESDSRTVFHFGLRLTLSTCRMPNFRRHPSINCVLWPLTTFAQQASSFVRLPLSWSALTVVLWFRFCLNVEHVVTYGWLWLHSKRGAASRATWKRPVETDELLPDQMNSAAANKEGFMGGLSSTFPFLPLHREDRAERGHCHFTETAGNVGQAFQPVARPTPIRLPKGARDAYICNFSVIITHILTRITHEERESMEQHRKEDGPAIYEFRGVSGRRWFIFSRRAYRGQHFNISGSISVVHSLSFASERPSGQPRRILGVVLQSAPSRLHILTGVTYSASSQVFKVPYSAPHGDVMSGGTKDETKGWSGVFARGEIFG